VDVNSSLAPYLPCTQRKSSTSTYFSLANGKTDSCVVVGAVSARVCVLEP
jgi:hypothetical protein